MIQIAGYIIFKKADFQDAVNTRLRAALYEFVDKAFEPPTIDDPQAKVKKGVYDSHIRHFIIAMTSRARKIRAKKGR